MIHDNIRKYRKERGLSQEEMAVRLHVVRQTVSKWENGKAFPDVNILEDLCRELGISISELLAGKRIEPEYCQKEAEKMLVDSVGEAQLYKFQIVLYAMGAAGAVYFILFLALNFCVAGGQETISNTASGEKLMVGMTAAAGLAFVVAARVIQAGVKRKRRGKKDGVSSG